MHNIRAKIFILAKHLRSFLFGSTVLSDSRVLIFLFKMRARGKVSLVDAFDGADLAAFAAIDAFFVIYRSEVILNDYCTRGTGALAFSAGYTAVFAELTNFSAFIMIVAGDDHPSRVAYKVNYTVRALLDAHSAADTSFR